MSPALARYPLLQPVDFCEHVLWPSRQFQISELLFVVILNAQFVLNRVQHFEDTRQFGFSEKPDVQVELRATICFLAQTILVDEYKGRQKDRL